MWVINNIQVMWGRKILNTEKWIQQDLSYAFEIHKQVSNRNKKNFLYFFSQTVKNHEWHQEIKFYSRHHFLSHFTFFLSAHFSVILMIKTFVWKCNSSRSHQPGILRTESFSWLIFITITCRTWFKFNFSHL